MNTEVAPSQESRILIVDDHPLFRKGLHEMIVREPGWQVCGEAAEAAEAIRLVEEKKPDLVIMDISLGQTNGIDLIEVLCGKDPELPILVVSMHDESLHAERSINAGAMGYLMKLEPPNIVRAAIHRVLAGEMYLSHKMAMFLVAKLTHGDNAEPKEAPQDRLSERELEVFRLLGHGKGARQIAEELNITVATVNSFRARIKEKLRLKNSTELMLHAINWVKEQANRNLPFDP
jgi:DNA-binding NarL/FixJ family response regulator